MADETFRQQKKKIDEEDTPQVENIVPESTAPAPPPLASLDDVHRMQRAAGVSVGGEEDENSIPTTPPPTTPMQQPMQQPIKVKDGHQVTGAMPPGMAEVMKRQIRDTPVDEPIGGASQGVQDSNTPFGGVVNMTPDVIKGMHDNVQWAQSQQPASRITSLPGQMPLQPGQIETNDPALNALLNGLTTQNYEDITLPSLGRFYRDDPSLPNDGVLHLRPMTGQEETILSTPRFMRRGRALEMIFKNCMLEKNVAVEKLLSIDRTYMLIFLRAISYGHLYEVTVKCTDCGASSDQQIDLNLPVDYCPEDFTTNQLQGVLPVTGYFFKYHLPNGVDEANITDYRDRKSRQGGNAVDDTFIYRASCLIDELGNEEVKIDSSHAIKTILERLPVRDVNHIRHKINEPPFGVNTEVTMMCASCYNNFPVELPYEANFFFPEETTVEI